MGLSDLNKVCGQRAVKEPFLGTGEGAIFNQHCIMNTHVQTNVDWVGSSASRRVKPEKSIQTANTKYSVE